MKIFYEIWLIFYKIYGRIRLVIKFADVAELADVQDLGSCVHDVQVRPLSSAPPPKTLIGFSYKCFVVSGVCLSLCEQLFFARFDFSANIFAIQIVC